MAKLVPPENAGVVVRMYRQGHGDCFLLAFPRDGGGEPVRVLIDCGRWDNSEVPPDRVPIERVRPLAAARDIGVLNGFSIVRGLLTGADPDAAAARGRWGNQEDVARARAIRQWCQERGVSLLALALQFCLREGRIHGNPLGSQNIAELEANVAAVTTPLPDSIFAEFAAAGL